MNDVTGMPQTAVVIGGGSDIALATLRSLAKRRLRRVVLLGRHEEVLNGAAAQLRSAGIEDVSIAIYDVNDVGRAAEIVEKTVEILGTVDLVFVAAGFLGDAKLEVIDPEIVSRTISTNFTGPAAVMTAFAHRLAVQGYGRFVVLSSVAGVRVRKSNFVYGSAKAGLDGFAQGLDDALVGTGLSVMIVRPGFVHSKMTFGLKAAPMAVTPEAVGQAIVRGLETGASVVWAPSSLFWVFAVLVHLPRRLWRLIPG
ncbi:MAG TPA: SDR family NAD(P)-dependent oxidoreductase [Acidimicrobiales bacterium]|nr:SDR family NAD(P)-dependent oxidoreductase [Acidimicrobiales bacterium]